MLHFEPGAAAADWTWIGNFSATSATADDIAPYLNRQVVTIRWGRAFPATGIRITLDERTSVRTSPTVSYSVTIESPALGIAQQTWTGDDWKLMIDGEELAAVECGAFAFEGTALRFYVDGVLVLDLGAQAHSGFGYDTRENKTRNHAQSSPDPIGPFPLIGCDSGDRWPPQGEIGSCTAKLQVYYDTGAGDTALDLSIDSAMACPATTPPFGCSACACSYSPPTISGTTSADQQCSAFCQLSRVYTPGGFTACTCPDGFVIHPLYHYATLDFYLGDSYVDLEDQSSTLLHSTRRWRRAACSCHPINDPTDYTLSDVTTPEAVTYCASHQDVQRITATTFCLVEDGDPCIIHRIPGDPVNPAPCPLPYADPCYYHCTLNLLWPSDLCGGSCCGSIDVSAAGRWFKAYIVTGTGNVTSGWAGSEFTSQNTPPAWHLFDAGFAADSLCLRFDKSGDDPKLWLLYASGGTVYARYSKDSGESWSAVAVTLGAGSVGSFDNLASSRRYVYRRNGTTLYYQLFDWEWTSIEGPGTVSGITIDSDSTIDVRSHSGGDGQWVISIQYKDGGNQKTAYSRDGKVFI